VNDKALLVRSSDDGILTRVGINELTFVIDGSIWLGTPQQQDVRADLVRVSEYGRKGSVVFDGFCEFGQMGVGLVLGDLIFCPRSADIFDRPVARAERLEQGKGVGQKFFYCFLELFTGSLAR
jgi:hypothetical protein